MMNAFRILFLSLVFACAGQAVAQECTETHVSKAFNELKKKLDGALLYDSDDRSAVVDQMARTYNPSNCLERRVFLRIKGRDLTYKGNYSLAQEYLIAAMQIGGMSAKQKSWTYYLLSQAYSKNDQFEMARWNVQRAIQMGGYPTEFYDVVLEDIDLYERWYQEEQAAKARQNQRAQSSRSNTAPRAQNCAPQYNNCMARLNHNLSSCLSDCQRNGYDGCNQDCREFADYDRPICESQYGHCKGNASGGGYASSGYGSSSQPQSDRNWERGDDFKDMFSGQGCPGVNYGSTCVCQRCAASYSRNSVEYRMYQGCEARFDNRFDSGYVECAVE